MEFVATFTCFCRIDNFTVCKNSLQEGFYKANTLGVKDEAKAKAACQEVHDGCECTVWYSVWS